MADLIQNMQEVYKKWERKPNFTTRGRCRNLQQNSGNFSRVYGQDGYQFDNRMTVDRPGERRFKSRIRTPQFKLPKYDGLAQFKMTPCVVALNKERPFVGSCCLKCLPMSRASISDKSVFSLCICNILHIPRVQSFDFNSILNILKKTPNNSYPSVSMDVFKNERIQQAVEKVIEDCQKDVNFIDNEETGVVLKSKQYTRVKNIFESLKTSVSYTCIQISSFILHYVFNRIFNGILIHKGHIEILKASNQDNIPLIYMPICRSNLDYVLISFILFMNSLKVPFIAIDYDLYIPVLGWLTRFLGAFYIKKCLAYYNGEKDIIQSAVIQSYLTECLKAGYTFEFCIGNGSSRPCIPHMSTNDFLSYIVNAVIEESVEDVNISTVSISYEKIFTERFVSKQLGETKPKETFYAKLCGFWRMMHFNLGYVKINFGQPFSLQEFLQTNKQKVAGKSLDIDTTPSYASSQEIHNSVVNSLAEHIVHDATFATSFMSTQLVSFLFMTKYRKGATQQQLQNSLDWLRGELVNKKHDIGFSGESLPVIKRAVELLGKNLISSEIIDMEWTSSDLENNNVKVTIYKPVTQLPYVLELQYYTNYVVPAFSLDSMVVNALYALVDVEICHFRHCDSKLYVFREKVIDKAVELSEMLQFEFVTIPPCTSIVLTFNDILDEFIEKECLHIVGVGIVSNNKMIYSKKHVFAFESSEDEEECSIPKQMQLKIDLKEESINHFEFLRSVLSPLIESYWLAAVTLLKLIDEIKEETLLIQEMQLTAQEKLYKGLLAYEESFSAVTFKNALKLFEHWQIVDYYVQDKIKIIYLNENYNCKERINDVIARIEEFRK